jgi:Protein of unknown function (DUF3139)
MMIGLILTPLFYIQINKKLYEIKVKHYLMVEKGYQEEEIKSVTGVWGVKLPPFYAVVVFEAEPFVECIYFAHNDVQQFKYRISAEGKQLGITEADVKHIDSDK